jgi:hypothetical protein
VVGFVLALLQARPAQALELAVDADVAQAVVAVLSAGHGRLEYCYLLQDVARAHALLGGGAVGTRPCAPRVQALLLHYIS